MKLSVDKALQVCGNNNRYQKLFYIAVALTWFSVDFVSISFPLLALEPTYQCKDYNGVWKENCKMEDICSGKIPKEDFKRILQFDNIISDFNLECERTFVMMIGVIYTIGVVMGAFLASKFADILGRKPVLLICQFLFFCGAISMTFAPSIYFILGILFFIGISCAGGTMVSFLYIYEVLAPNKRSIYGTLINSAFAIAGIIYFTVFKYMKNWKYLAYVCITADVIAGLLILTYFTESPRFLMSKGQTEKALKALSKIAKKNGKSKDFYKYLVSDVSESGSKRNSTENFEETTENTNGFLSSQDNTDKSEICVNLDRTTTLDKTTQNINNNFHSTLISNTTMADSPTLSQKKIEKIARGLDDNEEAISQISVGKNSSSDPLINSQGGSTKEAPFSALIKYKSLRKNFIICNFLWFAMAFTYYGISMGLKNSKEEVFVDGYVVYGAEGISYMIVGIILSVPFFGRVRSLYIMLMLCSISTCGYFFIKLFEIEPYDKILLFLARFSITAIFSIMYTYSTEVYPTVIRAKGLGINTLFARFAAILVPVVVDLINPFLIYSTVCFIGFFLALMLPETFGKELEDEIQEEKLSKKVYIEN
jgi:MFS family permease